MTVLRPPKRLHARRRRLWAAVIVPLALASLPSQAPAAASAPPAEPQAAPTNGAAASPAIASVLDGVSARLKALTNARDWTASAVNTVTETDDAWTPRKVTVVTKTVKVTAGDRDEEILKAVETQGGRTRDVTQKYAEEQKAHRERDRRRRESRAAGGAGSGSDGDHGGERRRRFDLDEMLPFAPEKRAAYDFKLSETPGADGAPLLTLEAAARRPDSAAWNGTFIVDPRTYDIVRAELSPSKNPRFVKTMRVEAEPVVVDGKYLVLRMTRFRVNAGMFLKHVRMIVEDVYSDVKVGG